MKLDYIFKFCRRRKYISLEQYGDMKYLSDGVVTVLVQGISPQWEIDDYFTAMGIEEESRENIKHMIAQTNKIRKLKLKN